MSRPERSIRLVEVGLRWPPETFVGQRLQRLTARGYEVSVAAIVPRRTRPPKRLGAVRLEPLPHWDDLGPRAWVELIVDLSVLLVRDRARLLRLCRALGARPRRLVTWRLYARLARLRGDVFHVEWVTFAVDIAPMIEVWGAPVVLSCHGPELQLNPYVPSRARFVEPLGELFGRAARVHCVSETLRQDALRRGLDSAKGRLIRPAVDHRFFLPANGGDRADRRFGLVGAGWFRWLKGWEYTLLAVAELERKGVRASLTIIGGDPPGDLAATERERILYTVDDLALADSIVLAGPAAPGDVRTHLQAADVLLHLSLTEGIPNVVLEAMACGVPVVATDVGGTGEAVTDGVEGFLVSPRDPRAAAAALERLWHDPALRARMGAAGRARVEADFTLDAQTERFAALYEEVVEGG